MPLQGTNAADLTEQARRAGARVVVVITETGIARVTPLGGLEKDALLGGPLVMDLGSEPDRRRAAIVIQALARLTGARPDFEPDRVACPPLDPSEPLDRIALLTLFVVPALYSIFDSLTRRISRASDIERETTVVLAELRAESMESARRPKDKATAGVGASEPP